MLEIDHYAYQNRWRQKNPMLKAALWIMFLLLALLLPLPMQITILILCIIVTLYVSHMPTKTYLQWLTMPMIFLIMSLIGILFSADTKPEALLISVPFNTFYIGISQAALNTAIHTFFRSFACLSVTFLFVLTTPFDQMIVIGKKLHVPAVLLEIVLLTYRFIFICLDEVSMLKQAQTLRFGYISLKTSYHSFGMLVNLLLQRIIFRYREMTITLETKLFKGDFPL